MKGIVITTEDNVAIRELGENLGQAVRGIVGGHFEIVYPVGLKRPFVMLVNEEGLLLDLELNAIGSVLYGTLAHGHPIVGNIVIMKLGHTAEGLDVVGLEDQEAFDLYQLFINMLVRPNERRN